MEFPFGHPHSHHHHRRDEAGEEPPLYPPPGQNPYAPPPVYPPVPHLPREYDAPAPPPGLYGPPAYPPVHHVAHEYGAPPPLPGYGENSYPSPGYPPVHHVSHEAPPPVVAYPPASGYGNEEADHHRHHHHHLHLPFSRPVEHVAHERLGELAGRRTVRVFTKAKEDFALTIRDGEVVLAPANPRDEKQHWIKDLRYSTKVKDQEGFPSFALVNKVTGEAIKHSVGATHPVRLVPYKPDYLDQSVLWTESKDTGEGFRCIRMVNNITLNFDAFHGDEDHGGVRDGTKVVLWEWLKGKNQRWKIVPY